MNLRAVLYGAFIGVSSTAIAAEQPSVAPGVNDRYATEEGRKAAIKIFEGEGREEYQKPEEVVRHLELEAGDVVCDIGAGSGYMTPYFSRAVGPKGRVYAEDPQPEFLDALRKKISTQRLDNVEVVVGTYTDTNLPDRTCDVAFILDAYHHFEWPAPMLAAIAGDLESGGKLVIVDFYRKSNPFFERWGVNAEKHLRLDRPEVIREIESLGWRLVDERAFLDYQYFLVFEPRTGR